MPNERVEKSSNVCYPRYTREPIALQVLIARERARERERRLLNKIGRRCQKPSYSRQLKYNQIVQGLIYLSIYLSILLICLRYLFLLSQLQT